MRINAVHITKLRKRIDTAMMTYARRIARVQRVIIANHAQLFY